jgi:hypothetical protein
MFLTGHCNFVCGGRSARSFLIEIRGRSKSGPSPEDIAGSSANPNRTTAEQRILCRSKVLHESIEFFTQADTFG